MSKKTHWAQTLPEAGRQIEQRVAAIEALKAKQLQLVKEVQQLDKDMHEAELALLQLAESAWSADEISDARNSLYLYNSQQP